jgi:hypothetical protein
MKVTPSQANSKGTNYMRRQGVSAGAKRALRGFQQPLWQGRISGAWQLRDGWEEFGLTANYFHSVLK